MDHRLFLKVKIKSLAAEAKIIRLEEERRKDLQSLLAEHRRGIVRHEQRHTLLAYGFLRGTPYLAIEPKCHEKPDGAKIWKMIDRYGVIRDEFKSSEEYTLKKKEVSEAFKDWLTAAG